MSRFNIGLALLFIGSFHFALPLDNSPCSPANVAAQQIEFTYKSAPVDNPLKGLVPYWGHTGPFPASMEFWYFPINSIMKGPDKFDWSEVEKKLEDTRSRGNQMVIRMYLEYPGKPSAMPEYLKKLGVKIIKYKNDDGINLTPDYHDPKLISAMEDFVAAFGKKYDGDPRLAFITMGVLGHWGEWHTYPKEKLFATKKEQTKIQDAFAKAFETTKVLMRYPAGSDDWSHAPNDEHPFGYHDDSFAWATLDTGKEDDSWFFQAAMKQAGDKALNKWKTQPIGGEIRPEIWGCVFDNKSCERKGQEFDKCVQQLHVSWLMDSGMSKFADPQPTKEQIKNATQQVTPMGYEFFIESANIKRTGDQTELALKVINKGVAPFYYQWPVEIVILGSDEASSKSIETDWDLTKSIPGESFEWKVSFKSAPGSKLGIRIRNPMKGGKPLRFANETQKENGLMLLEGQSK